MYGLSICEFEWSIFENSKSVIAIDDIRGQKVAIDARVWHNKYSHASASNTSGETKNFNLESIFLQLYCLVVEQIRVVVVFQKSLSIEFNDNCIQLLHALGIPYVEDENVASVFVELINKQIVDSVLTDDIMLSNHDIKPILRYSSFESEIANNRNQQLKMEKYFSSNTCTDLLQYFHPIASFLINKGTYGNISNIHGSPKPGEPSTIRPIISRACKKPRPPPMPSKTGKKRKTCEKVEETILKKLLDVVKKWMDDPMERMKNFKDAIKNNQIESLIETERELLKMYESYSDQSINKSDLSRIQPIKLRDGHMGSYIKKIEWKRVEFECLHGYLEANHIKLPTKQLLHFLVAYDFFELLNSHLSGDSFPEGFSRPEKVIKAFNENSIDMYEVKWFYIPGTHSLTQKDLVTMEMKNVFCAAFPKVASKFEGWNLKGDSDDDVLGVEDNFHSYMPMSTPGSPKKCLNKRKRIRENSMETPASASSSKSTVNQYFVARKKLTFDTMK